MKNAAEPQKAHQGDPSVIQFSSRSTQLFGYLVVVAVVRAGRPSPVQMRALQCAHLGACDAPKLSAWLHIRQDGSLLLRRTLWHSNYLAHQSTVSRRDEFQDVTAYVLRWLINRKLLILSRTIAPNRKLWLELNG